MLARIVPALCLSPLLAADPSAAVSVLEQRCHQCHNQKIQMGTVRLTSTADVTAVRDKLLAAITHEGKIKMPPTGPLPAAEAALLKDWIAQGATWPAIKQSSTSDASTWWAFRKPTRPAGNSIDYFLNAKLSEKALTPAPRAGKLTLIRRVHYDLLGLPPSYDAIQAFLNDPRPDAYSRMVDAALASPHYGEQWGKHWLDLARYGDTSGFEQDPYLLYAWRYRDYVIKSFNEDKPYDRLIRETIAGDEIFPEEPEAQQGTGFYTVGTNRDMLFKVEDINREESLTDFVDTTGGVFLGLTVGCARCHDHKFDPITQKDYYRMRAVFEPFQKSRVFLHYNMGRSYDLGENTRTFRLYEIGAQIQAIQEPHRQKIRDERLAKLPADVAEAIRTPDEKKTPEQKALADKHAREVEASDEEIFALLSDGEKERLAKIERRLMATFKTYAPGPFSPSITDVGRESPRTFLPAKAGGLGEEVGPGFLSALGGGNIPEPPRESATTQRRKALAEWIASPENPLTARVMVNRIWQYHFGRGLVDTPSDFGTRATASHRELLDWLATEFVSRKWSVKEMHRLILNSDAYQRASKPSPKAQESDPENVYLSYFKRRRLDSEELRDSMLAAAGKLNSKMGGRAVVPPLAAEELYGMSQSANNAWIVTEDKSEHNRRSIYMISRRNFRMPLLEVFDRPEGVLSCSRRESSTTAPQSLSLLNGQFTLQLATALSKKLEDSPDPVAVAWRALFGRDPETFEAERTLAFLDKQTKTLGTRQAALVELSRALFNANEFLYVE